jgi:uncharacterized protein YbaR (Trm112 family)
MRVVCPKCKRKKELIVLCTVCHGDGEVLSLHKDDHHVEVHALQDEKQLIKDGYHHRLRDKIPVDVMLKVNWMRVSLDDVIAAYIAQQISPAPTHVEWFIDPIKEVVIFNLTW